MARVSGWNHDESELLLQRDIFSSFRSWPEYAIFVSTHREENTALLSHKKIKTEVQHEEWVAGLRERNRSV